MGTLGGAAWLAQKHHRQLEKIGPAAESVREASEKLKGAAEPFRVAGERVKMASVIPYEMGNLFKSTVYNRGGRTPAGAQVILNPMHLIRAYREGRHGAPGFGTKIGASIRKIVKGYEDPSELTQFMA